MMEKALLDPQLKNIFRKLRDGRHLCFEDGDLFSPLAENSAGFTALFKALGYELASHRQGIYYFSSSSPLTDRARHFAVFTFILVESLGDSGKGIEESLFSKTWAIKDLPHLTSSRYQELMSEAGISTEADLHKLLTAMQRFGFTEFSHDKIRFRQPMYRLLDLCTQVLDMGNDGGES